ncbi:glycosyltransferase family 4 protein [Candidatus Parcubacteria bacterium]|nr:MAG: glycosyltransferase family 4 protein [Candidatus Parcubacteria bacterium]
MDQKKKQLLVFTSTFPRWQNDSKPSFVFELSKRLSNVFDVYVLAPHFPGAKKEEVLDGVSIKRFKYFLEKYERMTDTGGIVSALNHNKLFYLQIPFFIIAEFIALMRNVRRIKPDLILAHWVIPQGFLSYLNYRILRTPYTITSHGSDIFGIKGFKFLKKICFRHSKNITAVSKAIKDEILNKIDSSLTIDIIPMGVETDIFKPQMRDTVLLKRHNIKGPFLLFVGRLSAEKGISYLINAMPAVIAEYPEAKLLIIGDGDQKGELQQLVEKRKMNGNIVFEGKLPNRELPKYYATADAFICPSFREGSPVSYIESLACGTPLIVGDLPVCREIVNDDRGFIVKQNDSNDIAKKIILLLKAKKRPKNELHNFVKQNYDWNVISERFSKVINAPP